jgi:diketogulonate reductase-like aldo/keto reductase
VEEIEWYEANGVELLCWEVLAKGFMAKEDLWPSEEVDPTTFSSPVQRGTDEWRLQRIQKAYCNPENYRRRNLAIQLARQSDLKLAQIAMLYPLTKGKHISVIFGSAKSEHIDDMVELQHFNIDDTAMDLFVDPKAVKNSFFPYQADYVMDHASHSVQPFQKDRASAVLKNGNGKKNKEGDGFKVNNNPKTKTVPFRKSRAGLTPTTATTTTK